MKKKLFAVLIAALLLLSLSATALASGSDGGDAPHVYDQAGLLTGEQVSALESRAAEVSAEYECGVYIVTVEDFSDYDSYSVFDAATVIYKDNALGWGAEKSGVMLLLSMAERDYSLIAYGYGNTAFTDYGKDVMEEEFLDDFRDDDWNGGFADYIEVSANMLSQARAGSPVDVPNSQGGEHYYEDYHGEYNDGSRLDPVALAIALGVPALIALAVCLILKRQMRSVYSGGSAEEYITPGGVNIRKRTDRFLHTTRTQVKVESDSNGGGRGGTSISSGGFSGRSGKF